MLAIAVLAISVVHATDDDPKVDELLKAPGAVEQFKLNRGKNTSNGSPEKKSPLVVAAEELAKLINPPKSKISRPSVRPGTKISRRSAPKVAPTKVSPKFKLIGTCYSDIAANRCAFIDEPGQKQYWVRESDKIGHMTIKEIKDGVVIVHNGQGLEELLVEEPEVEVVSLTDDGKRTVRAPNADATEAPVTSTPVSTTSRPPVRRAGQSEAAYQAAVRAYRARRANSSAIKAVPKTGLTKPSQAEDDEGLPKPRITRRPISTNQDAQELESIVERLRNYDPAAGNQGKNKTPEKIAADRRAREELIKRTTALMRKGNLRGHQPPPSLGNRNEQLGGLRSGPEND